VVRKKRKVTEVAKPGPSRTNRAGTSSIDESESESEKEVRPVKRTRKLRAGVERKGKETAMEAVPVSLELEEALSDLRDSYVELGKVKEWNTRAQVRVNEMVAKSERVGSH
jgi:hypothetical protein